VFVYSTKVEGLVDDEQHESIEKQGKCTVIARAVCKLKRWSMFVQLFGKENAHEQPMLITKELILVIHCCTSKNWWYHSIGRGDSILGHSMVS
jgi:hypothetical protein